MQYRYNVDTLYYNIMYPFCTATVQLRHTPPPRSGTVTVAVFCASIGGYYLVIWGNILLLKILSSVSDKIFSNKILPLIKLNH